MEDPLIFGYQLNGVKTFCVTRGMFGAAQCWMSALFASKGADGTLSASDGEVSQNVLPRKA